MDRDTFITEQVSSMFGRIEVYVIYKLQVRKSMIVMIFPC